MDLENISQYSISQTLLPGNPFGSAKDFEKFPQEHKDQIYFLNDEASILVRNFILSSGIESGYYFAENWHPFQKNYFKEIEETSEFSEDEKLKKWLYNRGLPFKAEVFINSDGYENIVYTTWKMVVKYAPTLFFAHDTLVIDKTLNWCLYFHHEGRFYFGKDKIYDPEVGYQKKMEETKLFNEMRQKYPNINFPSL